MIPCSRAVRRWFVSCDRPVIPMLRLMPRTWRGELRSYTNTGEMLGNWSHSVSYAALAFCEGDDEPEKLAIEAEKMILESNHMGSWGGPGRRGGSR